MSDIAARRLNSVATHLAGGAQPTAASFERLRVERKAGQVPYYTPLDPIRFLLRSAMVYANKTAVVHGDRSYSYSALSDRVLKLANIFINDYKVKPGDRVAILCQNIPANLEASFAVPAAAAVLVPLNTRLVAAELEYVIQHSGASIVIVQEELKDRLSPAVLSSVKVIDVANYQNKGDPPCPYEQLLENCDSPRLSWNDLPLTQDENALISINYTSGSTGRPKGVQCTYRGCYLTALANCIDAQLAPESVYLWTLPMFHCNGWNYLWALVAVGSTQIMLNKLDYTQIWKLLKQRGVTHYCAAPTVQNELCNHPDASRLERPVRTFSGGAALSSTLIERLESLNIVPTMVYGLTETYGPAAHTYDPYNLQQFPKDQRHIMAARAGFAGICDDEMRVLNQETGEDVPANGQVIGEICMTGNQTMLGYYRDPKETERVFRRGVFWTGDLAVRHPDGAVEIVDRSKDVIVSGGENISSIEVEGVIVRLEQVMECAIVAGPDDKWGERPFAYVVLKPGKSLTAEALIAHCRKYLAGYKCPSKVFFVDSIPKTSTGKVQKYLLREGLWKTYTKRVN